MPKPSHRGFDVVKRVLDVVFAGVLLVLLLPVYAVLAIAVRVNLGTPVVFRQERPGKGARLFTMYKFRTMKDADRGLSPSEAVLSDRERLTPFGRFMRASSLDELPELVNILKGDMSFVGPRPLLSDYLDLYSREQARRHEVRPGITGWAQVNGRNAQTWDERLRLDVWYVDHRSLGLDARIIAKSFGTVISREGVSAPGSATMEPFRGSPGRGGASEDSATQGANAAHDAKQEEGS